MGAGRVQRPGLRRVAGGSASHKLVLPGAPSLGSAGSKSPVPGDYSDCLFLDFQSLHTHPRQSLSRTRPEGARFSLIHAFLNNGPGDSRESALRPSVFSSVISPSAFSSIV